MCSLGFAVRQGCWQNPGRDTKHKAPEPGRDGRTKEGAGLGQGLVDRGEVAGDVSKEIMAAEVGNQAGRGYQLLEGKLLEMEASALVVSDADVFRENQAG